MCISEPERFRAVVSQQADRQTADSESTYLIFVGFIASPVKIPPRPVLLLVTYG